MSIFYRVKKRSFAAFRDHKSLQSQYKLFHPTDLKFGENRNLPLLDGKETHVIHAFYNYAFYRLFPKYLEKEPLPKALTTFAATIHKDIHGGHHVKEYLITSKPFIFLLYIEHLEKPFNAETYNWLLHTHAIQLNEVKHDMDIFIHFSLAIGLEAYFLDYNLSQTHNLTDFFSNEKTEWHFKHFFNARLHTQEE